jgi:transglutaminase-like putative cysteine protease
MTAHYRIRHLTRYRYREPVTLCHNLAWLEPRTTPGQEMLRFQLEVTPTPVLVQSRHDLYGNRVHYIEVMEAHDTLSVLAASELLVHPVTLSWNDDRPWEEVCGVGAVWWQGGHAPPGDPGHGQFVLDSPLVPRGPVLADYARSSFPPGRGVLAGTLDLMQRIHAEFRYQSRSTTIDTPLGTVMEQRMGVCQDFAHVAIGALRSLGLAARYVSGYLETVPAPGTTRLVGADASHAWFSVLVPDHGQGDRWVDFDPTNNVIPSDRHITVAWGRDYTDVPPLKGIVLGGGGEVLEVSVDVQRVDGVHDV